MILLLTHQPAGARPPCRFDAFALRNPSEQFPVICTIPRPWVDDLSIAVLLDDGRGDQFVETFVHRGTYWNLDA